MTDYAIRAVRLSKRFWLHTERRTGLKERFIRGRGPKAKEFWALRDASFEIEHGSTFGLLGQNGAGKSTTLKVLAGIYRPTSGLVEVNGRVSALLELGAGFHGELTGRENIRLNGAILGLSRRQIDASMDRIIDFAGLGEFIDSPVKVYSSGMYVRLGFAVAVSLDPEILMVDEIIAVGDEEFQRKCFDHLFELRKRGSTIVLVSHSLGLIRDLCDQAAWLEHGHIRELGPARGVVDKYLSDVNDREVRAAQEHQAAQEHEQASARDDESIGSPNVGGGSVEQVAAATDSAGEAGSADAASAVPGVQPPEEPAAHQRPGSGEIRVTSVEYLDHDGNSSPILLAGAPCTMRMHYSSSRAIPSAVFGIGFFNEADVNVSGPNSGRLGSWPVEAGEGYVDLVVEELLLQPATYRVSTAIVDRGHTFDFADREYEMHVRGRGDEEPGVTRMPGMWKPPVQVPADGKKKGSRQEIASA
jgi:ABC-2 type transport system ATP-binding protein/lipopolysaccharide transport system ATP-binding protein